MSGTTRNAPVFRFAPSPNGALHLGHAYSALLNAGMASRAGGRLLLRIEDIDAARCTPEFEAGILRDLAWLGIAWEEPVRRQSDHLHEYEQALARLIADELVYPAFMSRGEARAHIAELEDRGRAWPRDPDGAPIYPGLDKALGQRERRRRMSEAEPFAWRLDTDAAMAAAGPLHWREFSGEDMLRADTVAARPQDWGDVVLARRDVPTSYHLSVVTDDALQRVTHVVRGLDLRPATSIHRLLQRLLGLPEPAYFHHRLILGPDGRKLSKSLRDTGLATLRDAGHTPGDIRKTVGL
ncbi:tRNA glutamyl-Q(34) synthetase GluQRS [Mesorhizobium sp. 10J20-29]